MTIADEYRFAFEKPLAVNLTARIELYWYANHNYLVSINKMKITNTTLSE